MKNPAITVLVVEDSKPIRDVMKLGLELEGFAVREAGDGKEALSILERGPLPDVILLDLLMPGMNGYELIKYLRGLEGPAARLPVFLLSAVGASPKEGLQVSGIFSKPVDFEELYSAIRRVCG